MLERLLGSDQPFRRQPFRSKNRKKRPEFREKSPKTGSVLSDVPKSRSAEVRRPVYSCAASAASQRHASWPFSCGGASPPRSLFGGGCGRLWWRSRYWRWPRRKPAAASLDWVQRTAVPPRFHRCRHRCARRSHLFAGSPHAHMVRVTPTLVGACDGAPQACWWRWGPPNGRWRLLGRCLLRGRWL